MSVENTTLGAARSVPGLRIDLRQSLGKYRALMVAVTLSFIASYALELVRSSGGVVLLHEAMNAFMGCFFVIFALPKLRNVDGFVEAFRRYDLVAGRSPVYGRVYPFIELALGFVLLSNYATNSSVANTIVSGAVIGLTTIGSVGIIGALRSRQRLDCACLGAETSLPLSWAALVENGVMLVMALGMLFFYHSLHSVLLSLTHLKVMG